MASSAGSPQDRQPNTAEDLAQIKQPATIFVGPYGHPFHPMLVPIPIGAWVASVLFAIASNLVDDPLRYTVGAKWLIVIGLLGAIAAAGIGLIDLFRLPRGTRVWRRGLLHLAVMDTAILVFLVVWLTYPEPDAAVPALHLTLMVVALGLVAAGGWLGGSLAYRFGVRVADEDTQRTGLERT